VDTLFSFFSSLTSENHLLGLFIDLTIKVSLIIALAYLAIMLFKRASSAVRHMIWTFSIIGILLMPFVAVTIPDFYLPILNPLNQINNSEPIAPSHTEIVHEQSVTDASMSEGAHSAGNNVNIEKSFSFPVSLQSLLTVIWLVGSLMVLSRLTIGLARVRFINKHATPLRSKEFNLIQKTCAERTGIIRTVRLLMSDKVPIPVTIGIFMPIIMLPENADNWTRQRKELVLMHEYAHIKRCDVFSSGLALLATILYWYNPLVWLASIKLNIERERSCDDFVLSKGSKASEYAHHLLEIAKSLNGVKWSTSIEVAMAQKSSLEGRLLAILNDKLHRGTLKISTMIIMGLIIIGFTVPLTSMQISRRSTSPVEITGEDELAVSDIPIAIPETEDQNSTIVLSDEELIKQTHAEFYNYFEAQNFNRVLNLFSSQYMDRLLDRNSGSVDEWKKYLKRKYFSTYEDVTFNSKKVSIQKKGDNYFLQEHCAIIGKDINGNNILMKKQERVFQFVKEDGDWKISKTNF
jgi:beta-lactamase regulating signal transducer with metallopeptidase domain/ketosteroid isomerase-like protein